MLFAFDKGGEKAGALPLLKKHVGDEDLTLRNVILFGLERVGDASVTPELEAAKAPCH